ncbi:efflux RND transporter periplasmic adaptor subunit [Kiritimatiellaeota bacterium B1221]|nr:efflux RND transporter periplasmic adaptor subunit [Kiritimatiellaeota bacterium B1221]
MFIRIILLLTVLHGMSPCCLPARAEAQKVTISPKLRFRAKTFARENDPIRNPIPWVQFKDMLPEGTRVQKGDMVFHLDVQGVLEDVWKLENRLKEAENEAARQLAEMRKTVSTLEDQRAEKIDARDIQAARLTYLKSLPVEADIQIAQGRLDVAQETLQANKIELDKSRERLKKGLISPAMLKEDELQYAEQLARTEYAEKMLAYTKLSAHPLSIEVVEFRIRNLELEIKKLEAEIPIKEKILEIETTTQQRRIEDLKSQLAERHIQLENEYLYAPSDGVLMYSPQLKRELTVGGKAVKGMVLAQIPRKESMALEGVIPEQLRHLYKQGDPAEVQLNLYPGRSFPGVIASISPFSRDAAEGDNPSGVKVVDLIVEMKDFPEILPLGVYGWITLSTQNPLTGWAVPAEWVRYRGGKAHVSVDGTMQAINGIIHEDLFFLTPPHPTADRLQAEGEWTETTEPGMHLVTDQFMVTGELIPFESEIITAPRIRAWDLQIAWLAPENMQIQAGEPILELGSEQLSKDLDNRRMEVKKIQGERESAEEELSISQSEQAFQLSSARNRIEIMKRERDLVYIQGNTSEIHQSKLDLITAELQVQKAEREVARSIRNAEWTASAEQARLERDLKRRKLELERAQINHEQALEGATDLEKSSAELDLLKEKANVAELEAQHYRTLTRAQSVLRWRIAREKREKERLDRHIHDVASMKINAPTSGLVKYLKAWDGVRNSKVKTGMKVWRGMALISLSAAEKLYVEVPVPERYIQELTPEMQVAVRIPSEGGMQWQGKIIHQDEILEAASQTISTQSLYGNREAPQEQVLNVRILVENSEGTSLKPGAIAQIIFPFEK